jgi:hypothetical protein
MPSSSGSQTRNGGDAKAADPNEATKIKIVVPATDEARVRTLVANTGGSALPASAKYEPPAGEKSDNADPNFAPLVVLVAVLSAGYLAETIFGLWRQAHYPGLILSANSSGEFTLRPSQSLPGGTVVVVKLDGKTEIVTATKESDLAKVLETALGKK